jgi:hypothetical protein
LTSCPLLVKALSGVVVHDKVLEAGHVSGVGAAGRRNAPAQVASLNAAHRVRVPSEHESEREALSRVILCDYAEKKVRQGIFILVRKFTDERGCLNLLIL